MRRKNKKAVSEESTPKGRTPHDIGLNGTVEDFYAAVKTAEEDLAVKKTAYEVYAKKTKYGMTESIRYWDPFTKYLALQSAYLLAKHVPPQIRQGFNQGAIEAFLDNPSRPENIQHILSNPKDFCTEYETEDGLVTSTLVTLLSKSGTPDTVSGIAFEKVAEDKKHGILDRTLLALVSGNCTDIESSVSILLKAGADASYDSNQTLAKALYRDAPAGVLDMLIKHGADCDKALQTMRDNRGSYGDIPYKLEILQQAARIRQLEETIEELTGEKPQTRAAVAPPASTEATRPRTELRQYRLIL
jgi:hypothetical protein